MILGQLPRSEAPTSATEAARSTLAGDRNTLLPALTRSTPGPFLSALSGSLRTLPRHGQRAAMTQICRVGIAPVDEAASSAVDVQCPRGDSPRGQNCT